MIQPKRPRNHISTSELLEEPQGTGGALPGSNVSLDPVDEVYITRDDSGRLTLVDDSLTDGQLGSDIKVGSLALLDTADQSSIVAAINEIISGMVSGTVDAGTVPFANAANELISSRIEVQGDGTFRANSATTDGHPLLDLLYSGVSDILGSLKLIEPGGGYLLLAQSGDDESPSDVLRVLLTAVLLGVPIARSAEAINANVAISTRSGLVRLTGAGLTVTLPLIADYPAHAELLVQDTTGALSPGPAPPPVATTLVTAVNPTTSVQDTIANGTTATTYLLNQPYQSARFWHDGTVWYIS